MKQYFLVSTDSYNFRITNEDVYQALDEYLDVRDVVELDANMAYQIEQALDEQVEDAKYDSGTAHDE